jgi:hypothetical protein
MPQILPDTSAVAVRHAVQVPDNPRTLCRVGVTRQVRWLRKLVAGLTAAAIDKYLERRVILLPIG